MSRRTRIEACRLAAQAMQGELAHGDVAGRLMALCIFFEKYIDDGANVTERDMRLLSRRKVKNLQVVAGGGLGSKKG